MRQLTFESMLCGFLALVCFCIGLFQFVELIGLYHHPWYMQPTKAWGYSGLVGSVFLTAIYGYKCYECIEAA